ncbi:MAG: hypothetical protein WC327_04510 [Candidatus Cloacimonadia bacterium]
MKKLSRLISAIEEKDYYLARSIVIGYANQSYRLAKEAVEYIKENAPQIFDEHDEELYPIDGDQESFDQAYWDDLTSDLMHNFSIERVDHMLRVLRKIRLTDDKESESQKTDNSYIPYAMLIGSAVLLAAVLILWMKRS